MLFCGAELICDWLCPSSAPSVHTSRTGVAPVAFDFLEDRILLEYWDCSALLKTPVSEVSAGLATRFKN